MSETNRKGTTSVPLHRIRALNDVAVRGDGTFVLYWMVASRRARFNFGLQHAVNLARELGKPLLILEALRCGYPWASERLHRFVLDGMADNAERFRRAAVLYYPYVELQPGDGKGLLQELSRQACGIVTDDYPAYFLPRMVEAGARRSHARVEAVDSNGLLPLDATDRAFPTAHTFRRFLQRELREHLDAFPVRDPLARVKLSSLKRLPVSISGRWPRASRGLLSGSPRALAGLPIDHAIGPTGLRGGSKAARAAMKTFVDSRLERYAGERNRADREATSGLSPYLHFGHLSSHEVFLQVMKHEGWAPLDLGEGASGSRSGWWGVRPSAEAFLDQLVTWRELGHNMCRHMKDFDRYESLPAWALKTLGEHELDLREHLYSLEQFDDAATHDPVWNAAQRQLRREGTIHNYLRMLWGKKIVEWSETPRTALAVMIELNNKYALDGRDPNSYSGIFWVLGRFDRAWGPERPVFGKVRYMTSRNTVRKMDLSAYLERYAE